MSSAVLTSPSVERVREALSRAGLADTIVELPGAARTAKRAAGHTHAVFRLSCGALVRITGGDEVELA